MLRRGFIAAVGLPLVAGSLPSASCSLQWLLIAVAALVAGKVWVQMLQQSQHVSSQALECGVSSCGAQA